MQRVDPFHVIAPTQRRRTGVVVVGAELVDRVPGTSGAALQHVADLVRDDGFPAAVAVAALLGRLGPAAPGRGLDADWIPSTGAQAVAAVVARGVGGDVDLPGIEGQLDAELAPGGVVDLQHVADHGGHTRHVVPSG